jgi:hypothetical protein
VVEFADGDSWVDDGAREAAVVAGLTGEHVGKEGEEKINGSF